MIEERIPWEVIITQSNVNGEVHSSTAIVNTLYYHTSYTNVGWNIKPGELLHNNIQLQNTGFLFCVIGAVGIIIGILAAYMSIRRKKN